MDNKKLDRQFYQTDAVEAAKRLIGKILVHKTCEGVLKGRIVEAEAYKGPFDKAAHAYNHKGREGRTAVLYRQGGFAYVFLIYGMYNCFNVSVAGEGSPECVLIRALEPVEGLEQMKKNRNTDKVRNLCSGPGKLCLAMKINKNCYGLDLCGDELYLETDGIDYSDMVEVSKRINIDYAEEAADYLWRFTLKGNGFISVKNNKKR
ncbi:DNA-3-methyladenine glycosylase [Lachnospiraceae bacterium NSJ-143]|mgnify:CR=1 FL=1|nr:DNA-3-methyladenine glycosylase [Lachnospiraceae bacterium NSJ-143]